VANGAVTPVNAKADYTTSPTWFGNPSLGFNEVILWTYWAQWITMTVVDQNGKPIDSSYYGQDVYEFWSGDNAWHNINQKISGCTYKDPVFVFLSNLGTNVFPKYNTTNPADQAIINSWLAATPQAMGIAAGTYPPRSIRVKVAGVELFANWNPPTPSSKPAIQGRVIIATVPANIQITWPDTP
jgi:hypothetical protein